MECELMIDKIKQRMNESIKVKEMIISDDVMLDNIKLISREMIKCFENKKQVFFCGNGGSAADAQHLAAELSGRFYIDREPLNAEALHVNTSFLTAVANDYSYDEIYARMIKSKGSKQDILVAISTSGSSKNIIKAIYEAKNLGIITIGLTGKDGGEVSKICDIAINVPSNDTARIQESHILIGHILCEIIEKEIFSPSIDRKF